MAKTIWEFSKTILVAVVIALLITSFVKPTLVKGHSMAPTIEPNNYILINKVPYLVGGPDYGDIVVFKANVLSEKGEEKDLIKRVVALEGDEIVITQGQVFRNDMLLSETYLESSSSSGDMDAEVVPENSVFVMGDNRQNSLDSRDPAIGMVPISSILGRADLRLYPFDKMGMVNKVKE